MDEETKELLESIDNRLKWLLKFQVVEHFDDDATNKEKVRMMHEMGFSTGEMAEIVGTSEGSVRGTLSKLRQEDKIE